MSKVKITESFTASDSEEAKNFDRKWEVIISEKKSGNIYSKVTIKSNKDLAAFLIQGWIEYGFNLAEGMRFDDEMKAIMLKEWGKQLLSNLKNIDWDNINFEKDDDED